ASAPCSLLSAAIALTRFAQGLWPELQRARPSGHQGKEAQSSGASNGRARMLRVSVCCGKVCAMAMPIAEEGNIAMLLSRNADVKAIKVNAIEGRRTYGGDLLVKPLIKGDEMTFLEIHYAPGVGAPLHAHAHEAIVYVVKGKVRSKVGSEEFMLGPGDVWRHPRGVLHGLEAIEESVVVEIKAPAPEIASFYAMGA